MQPSDLNSIEKAMKIVEMASNNGVTLRLIGGLAIRVHCHGPHSTHLRTYGDIDLFGLKKESSMMMAVFQKLGYFPNVEFNALYGMTRLQFIHEKTGEEVDIFLDKFRMDHTLDLRNRIYMDDLTIPITDLFLTKIQIVKLETKDIKDVIAILEDHQIGHNYARETLNLDYFAELCSKYWGLYKTITINLRKILEFIKSDEFAAIDKKKLIEKLETIENVIKSNKKKLRWKLRNIVGERVRWFEEVEKGEREA